jgi:hypothetical protein
MNLQEMLNHRTTCLVHNKPMTNCVYIGNGGPFKVKNVKILEHGIEVLCCASINHEYTKITFGKDGKISSEHPINIPTIQKAFRFAVGCEDCNLILVKTDLGSGATTLSNIRHQNNYYVFDLCKGEELFSGTLLMEVIKYNDGNKFYHVSANLLDGSAQFKMGSCHGETVIEQLLSSLMHIDAPKFDPTKITSLEQLVQKIKLYNLLS